MFEPLPTPPIWIEPLRYFGQMFLSYPLVTFAAFPAHMVMLAFQIGVNGPKVRYAGYQLLLNLLAGSVIGWLSGRNSPQFIASGRWIWTLPSAFTLPFLWDDLSRLQPGMRLPDTLFIDDSKMGGVVVYLFTLPTFCAIGYSIGMSLVGRRLSRTALAAVAATFGVLAAAAYDIEKSRISAWTKWNAWSKLPYLTQNLPFSADPNKLCAWGGTTQLPRGTKVTVLERRNCGPDKVLDPGAPFQTGMWSLARIKVLDGSHAGAEGWVLDFGVSDLPPR